MPPALSAHKTSLPKHVGIIMDGNGRWAQKRGLPRTKGHQEGLETAKKIVAHASDTGIECLSLYVFSTENWKRAEEEVNFLMTLIRNHLRNQYNFYKERGMKILHSGDLDRLPDNVRKEIILAEKETENFDGMKINLLINYGGRNEIIRGFRKFLENGGNPDNLTENNFSLLLDNPEFPDLDLLIRTGGEIRLSNFLLWQSAYAELYFTDTLWPDWSTGDFDQAVDYFKKRQRRFGGVPSE